jgi:hypothetical protein
MLLFAGTLSLFAAMAMVSFRRTRALRQAAEELGLQFQDQDQKLATSLRGALPMFSHAAPECTLVLSGKIDDAEYALFEYSYRRTRFGYPERKSEGPVACFWRREGKYDTQIAAGGEHPAGLWHIEADGPWLAMRPLGRPAKPLEPDELRDFHHQVLDVYRTVVEA